MERKEFRESILSISISIYLLVAAGRNKCFSLFALGSCLNFSRGIRDMEFLRCLRSFGVSSQVEFLRWYSGLLKLAVLLEMCVWTFTLTVVPLASTPFCFFMVVTQMLLPPYSTERYQTVGIFSALVSKSVPTCVQNVYALLTNPLNHKYGNIPSKYV